MNRAARASTRTGLKPTGSWMIPQVGRGVSGGRTTRRRRAVEKMTAEIEGRRDAGVTVGGDHGRQRPPPSVHPADPSNQPVQPARPTCPSSLRPVGPNRRLRQQGADDGARSAHGPGRRPTCVNGRRRGESTKRGERRSRLPDTLSRRGAGRGSTGPATGWPTEGPSERPAGRQRATPGADDPIPMSSPLGAERLVRTVKHPGRNGFDSRSPDTQSLRNADRRLGSTSSVDPSRLSATWAILGSNQ